MSGFVLAAHLGLAFLWLGCIATVAIVSRTVFLGDESRLQLSRLHWMVAAFVELPTFLGVLFTGAQALGEPHSASLGFKLMLTVGLLTIFFAVFKVWLIFKRFSAARRGSWPAHDLLVGFQRQLSICILFGVFTATAAGLAGRIVS